jgi:membrane-bound serine protease (ClpP class)
MAAAILLVIGSLAIFILEVFLVSFGVLSAVAIALGAGGIILAFKESALFGWILLGSLVVALPICVTMAFKLLPKLPFARGFYLRAPKLTDKERHAAAPSLTDLLGQVGEATSALRPSGSAILGGKPVQVVSTGELISPGARIKVVEVTGNRIVVEEVPGSS